LLSFPEHFNAVLQITFLAHVLFLDVLVDDGALDFLVLDEIVKLLVDRLLQLLVVVSVLHDPVDCVLLLVNLIVVFSDDGSEFGNLLGHRLLLDAEVVNLEARLSIRLVEVFEIVVEGVRLRAELEDLLLLGCDGAVEVLDLVVEDELELLELLGLLFQAVDFLLASADKLITLANLCI